MCPARHSQWLHSAASNTVSIYNGGGEHILSYLQGTQQYAYIFLFLTPPPNKLLVSALSGTLWSDNNHPTIASAMFSKGGFWDWYPQVILKGWLSWGVILLIALPKCVNNWLSTNCFFLAMEQPPLPRGHGFGISHSIRSASVGHSLFWVMSNSGTSGIWGQQQLGPGRGALLLTIADSSQACPSLGRVSTWVAFLPYLLPASNWPSLLFRVDVGWSCCLPLPVAGSSPVHLSGQYTATITHLLAGLPADKAGEPMGAQEGFCYGSPAPESGPILQKCRFLENWNLHKMTSRASNSRIMWLYALCKQTHVCFQELDCEKQSSG